MNVSGDNAPTVTVIDVIRDVFRRFESFAQQYLVHPKPPALLVMMWLIGMDGVAGAIELEYILRGEYLTTNWFHAWLRMMSLGLFAGAGRYWIVGTLFYFGVRLCGGQGLPRTARYLFLYAAVPVAVVDLSLKVAQMLIYRDAYFLGRTASTLDAVITGIVLGAYIFSARLCFIGMVRVMDADRARSMLLIGGIATGMFVLTLISALGAQ